MSFVSIGSTATTSRNASNPASASEKRKPQTAQQLIRENVQYLIEQLEAGRSEALTAYLDAMVHFRNYSFGNVLLIARQKPQATYVSGMWSWNQLGRRVKRGEKGIAILAPMVAKTRREERRDNGEADSGQTRALLGFRRVYVWERLSRDLRSRFCALGTMRGTPRADSDGSPIIPQFG